MEQYKKDWRLCGIAFYEISSDILIKKKASSFEIQYEKRAEMPL